MSIFFMTQLNLENLNSFCHNFATKTTCSTNLVWRLVVNQQTRTWYWMISNSPHYGQCFYNSVPGSVIDIGRWPVVRYWNQSDRLMKWTVVRVKVKQLKDLVEGNKGNIWWRSGRVMLGVSWEANVNCLSGTDSNSDVLHESLMHYMTTNLTPFCPTTYRAHWFLQLHWKLGMDINCEVRNHPMQM